MTGRVTTQSHAARLVNTTADTSIVNTLPPSRGSIRISIIDTSSYLVCAATSSVDLPLPGQRFFNFDTYSFLLEHAESNQRLLFDAGARVDWWNLAPETVAGIHESVPGFRVHKNINQILREGGVDDQSIDAIIWSHHHFDHIGDPSLFPPTTRLIVGAGFKDSLTPAYPSDLEAALLKSDLAGRTLEELEFGDGLRIGGFRAIDYFNDGSLYLLDTPGHAPAHLSALVRTTADTFILLGGDACDAPQVLRPTEALPLPESYACRCRSSSSKTKPLSRVSSSSISFYEDPAVSQQTVDRLTPFDADSKVFMALAHDRSLRFILPFFPNGCINDWYAQGWKDKVMWKFLDSLGDTGELAEDRMIVDGLYQGDKCLRPADAILEALEREVSNEPDEKAMVDDSQLP